MKKLIYIFSGLLIVSTGCKKEQLQLYPYNQIETSQAFNTEADVTLAVNGMYEGIRSSGSYYVGTWNIMGDVLADNLVLNQQGRLSLRTFYQWQYNGDNTLGLFAGGYTVVRRANAILENIDKFPAGTFRDNAKAEALAVRAMTYFDMSRVYSKTYTNASDADVTIPYVTTTDPAITPGMEPVKGFYNKVVADLQQASELVGTANGIYRFNKTSVQAILSRVLLYKGDYAGVITAATAAAGATPNVGDITTFPSIWTDATSAGVLLKIRNTTVDNINTPGVNYYQSVGGEIKSEYLVDYGFYQQFASNDVRKNTYIRTSVFNGVNYNNVIKWAGRGGTNPAGVLDGKVIRTAEVLLNRAEAYYRSGNEASALADLRLLKKNRYTGYVDETLSGQALLDEILRQRRLELAFEGDRFWDLKRRNEPVQRSANGDKADGTGTAPLFRTLAAGDYHFNLPMPQSEVNFNSNIKQNPGY
jgi:starch-binding outer membrane protein, SusD/RagB family